VAEVTRKLTALGKPPASLTLINPTALARKTAGGSSHADPDFIRQRLELYWDEFREGDWRDRARLIANKAKKAASLLTGGESSAQSKGELLRFRVEEANKNAALQYIPVPLEARARLFITTFRGEGEDPRLEWLSLISPRPDVVPVQGINAGDAISPANVRGFADVFRAWLHTTADVTTSSTAGDTG
jgi:hypothetical protein